MWTPSTIDEWLEERITFVESVILSTNKINSENKTQISDFTIALSNFKYCKRIYLQLLTDLNNVDIKYTFKNIANKLLFDSIYELDKQEHKCLYIKDVLFTTKEKDILTQENFDNIKLIRISLNKISNQIQKI